MFVFVDYVDAQTMLMHLCVYVSLCLHEQHVVYFHEDAEDWSKPEKKCEKASAFSEIIYSVYCFLCNA